MNWSLADGSELTLRDAVPYFCAAVVVLWGAYRLYRWLRERAERREIQLLSQSRQAGYDLVQQRKWPEAVAALDRALALVQHEPGLAAELHFHKGYALEQTQQLEQAVCEYAACRASEAGRLLRKYSPVAAFRHGHVLTQLERWEEAEKQLQQTVEEATRIPLPELALNALRILLEVYQAARRYAEAADCAREALRLARSLGDESSQAFIFDTAGDICVALGQPEDALHYYEQSLDLFRKLGRARAELVVKQDIGKLYQGRGEWDKAFTWLHACLREGEYTQDLNSQAQICYEIACLHISNGGLGEAASFLERSLALFRQVQDKASAEKVGRTMMGLGLMLHRQATADQMTFRDIERGSAKSKEGEE